MANATTYTPLLASPGFSTLKITAGLLLVLGIILLLSYLIKKFGPRAGLKLLDQNQLKIMAKVSLGPKRDIFMVRFLNKILLIGVTDQQINLVAETEQRAYAERDQEDFDQIMADMHCHDPSPPGTGPDS